MEGEAVNENSVSRRWIVNGTISHVKEIQPVIEPIK